MHNGELAEDYVRRAGVRLTAIDVLYQAKSWADVVRECQEAVELALKGLLRACHVRGCHRETNRPPSPPERTRLYPTDTPPTSQIGGLFSLSS